MAKKASGSEPIRIQLADGRGKVLATISTTQLPYDGNLYLHLDGAEYGSLWIRRQPSGVPAVTLGAFDPDADEWAASETLLKPIPETFAEPAER